MSKETEPVDGNDYILLVDGDPLPFFSKFKREEHVCMHYVTERMKGSVAKSTVPPFYFDNAFNWEKTYQWDTETKTWGPLQSE